VIVTVMVIVIVMMMVIVTVMVIVMMMVAFTRSCCHRHCTGLDQFLCVRGCFLVGLL
jgi:hypothetical protein